MNRSLGRPLGPNLKKITFGFEPQSLTPIERFLEQSVTYRVLSMLLDVQININSIKSSFKQMIVSNEEDPPQVS